VSQYCINIENYPKDFYEPLEVHEPIFVANLWYEPRLYGKYRSHKISKETFTLKIWYFFYEVGRRMYDSGIREFNEATVHSFLVTQKTEPNKPSFHDTYINYGGIETIETVINEIPKDDPNDAYHFNEIQKYESLRKLVDKKMIDISDQGHINKLCSMSLTELQTYMGYTVKNAFSQINSGEVIITSATDGIRETIKEAKKGMRTGLPFFHSPRLNETINGQKNGNMVLLAFSSGVGKSSFITEKSIMSLYEHNIDVLLNPSEDKKFEKALVFVNEEGKKQWQLRLLATVVNKVFKRKIPRKKINKGFDDEIEKMLIEAELWLTQAGKTQNIDFENLIQLVVLKKYKISNVIDQIELFRPRGYDKIYFDTYKPDTSSGQERWLAFSNSAQELHDVIKEENLNCFLLASVQLKIGKEFRYLDLDSLGKSPEISEVAAVVLAGRKVYDDEYEGEKHAIQAFNFELDSNGEWTEVKYTLNPKHQYLILFVPKNREGKEDVQILFRMNLDFNSWEEVAWAKVKYVGRAGA